MAKVYKDIDEVIKPTRVPRKLWKIENEMKKKPNYDHIDEMKLKEEVKKNE
ncbi:MAG: hypothetical protein RR835_12280 [Peptostreptococcaceae bacterium]